MATKLTTGTVNEYAPAPETRTWCNVKVRAVHNYDGTPPRAWRVNDVLGTHELSAEEWEMKVEFTRKPPKPLEYGEAVEDSLGFRGTIEYISTNDKGRLEYWVRSDLDGSHVTYYAEMLKRRDN